MKLWIAVVACLALGLCGCGVTEQPDVPSEVVEIEQRLGKQARQQQLDKKVEERQRAKPTVASFPTIVEPQLVSSANEYTGTAVDVCFKSWFNAYANSRVIYVEPQVREPLEFGPWTAVQDFGTTDAHDDGSLTEWASNYYITHDWSDYGQQILALTPGDTVSVNGRQVHVDGLFNYPKDSFYEEIVEVCGSDKVIFQTCYPDSEQNRVVYGT